MDEPNEPPPKAEPRRVTGYEVVFSALVEALRKPAPEDEADADNVPVGS